MFSRRSMFRNSGAGALAALATAVFPEFARAEVPRPGHPDRGDRRRSYGDDGYGYQTSGYGEYGYRAAPDSFGPR
ncbi:hypothetical protein [Nocardia sp. NPDC024068]|uniref:hypothetical protein n=1 Tax=Nocardia sp. NPDC024068 TaxID=3157197 RepID=UPI0033E62101